MKTVRTFKFGVLLSAALVALFMAQAGLSFAHAHYKSSNIAANATVTSVPASLTVTFDDNTSPTQTKMQVTDASGKPVDKGDLKVNGANVTVSLGTLADGKYTVTYRTLTEDDGGIVNGSFTFTVAKSGATSTGTGTPTEAESGGDNAPTAAPATGQAGLAEDGGFHPGLLFGLLSLTCLAGAGLLLIRQLRHR